MYACLTVYSSVTLPPNQAANAEARANLYKVIRSEDRDIPRTAQQQIVHKLIQVTIMPETGNGSLRGLPKEQLHVKEKTI